MIRNKPALTKAIFDRLPLDLRGRAFTISGVEGLDALARVREATARLSEGGDFDELKEEILAELSPWLVNSEDAEERLAQMQRANRRAELLLRMHGWQSYAATQFEMMEEQIEVFPFRQYLTSNDTRVRSTHAALNNKVLPADDPFWQNHTPPWEFGCRCDVVALTAEDVEEMREADAKLPREKRRVMDAEDLELLKNEKVILDPDGRGQKLDVRTPREKTGDGYEWRPGDAGIEIDQILERFDPAERATFESWARGTEIEGGIDLWEWANGARARSSAPKPVTKKTATVSGTAIGTAVSTALVLAMRSPATRDASALALAAIDRVHGDGVLPEIPITGDAGSALGLFRFPNGAPLNIGVKATGPWQAMTTAHEVGHFLDFSALPGKGFTTTNRSTVMDDFLAAIRKTTGFREVMSQYDPRGYYSDPREFWARAYAQFIAEESGDKVLLADLKRIRESPEPWRQWSEEDFAPVRAEMKKIFKKQKWMK